MAMPIGNKVSAGLAIAVSAVATLVLLVQLSACCLNDEKETSYRLESTQRHLLPYSDGQVINFRHTDGVDFEVRVEKRTENLSVVVNDCLECCPEREKLEVEVISFSADTIWFPVLAAVPLKSRTAKDLQPVRHHLKVLEPYRWDRITEGSGDYLRVDKILQFDDQRHLICNADLNVTCHPAYSVGGNSYTNVVELQLMTVYDAESFSFYSCFFNQDGLLSIQQTDYVNNLPVRMAEYYRIH